MIGALKQRLTGAMNKVSGNKDFLEGVCAACALVAASDGDISDDEIENAIKAVTGNAVLAGAFSSQEITRTMETMLKRTTTRTGKAGLYQEIDEAAATTGAGETIYLAALDVADADGTIEEAEDTVLEKIATRLGVDRKALDV